MYSQKIGKDLKRIFVFSSFFVRLLIRDMADLRPIYEILANLIQTPKREAVSSTKKLGLGA